jgi:multicomponent Na+:H+ antiporter subunit A
MLIKICFYGLIRACNLIGGEITILPFIFFCGLAVFDLTLRLVIQTDLKAITAYGSVLHVNLLIILFLLDTNTLNNGLIFYIWGHSYATAGIFFAINLIERSYSSRSTFEISGVFMSNPLVGLAAIFAVITFLEFPLSFFFWGEF